MKKFSVFFAFVFAASLFGSCGAPEIAPVKLTNFHNGQYYSISYPDGFDITTSGLDLTISGNGVTLIVKKEPTENVQRGSLASLNMLKYELEQKTKREGANLLVTEAKIGAESALAFEYEGTSKYGLLYAVPLEGHIILVGSDNPQELGEGDIAANRVEQIKAIVGSFRVTRPDYFDLKGGNDTGTTDNGNSSIKTKPFENEYFKFNIPENWVATGEDMITIQPSNSTSISSGQEISVTNIANAGKSYSNYANDLFKVFGGANLKEQLFGEKTYTSYTFMLDGQERIHLFTGKNNQVVMINASSVAGKLLPEHEEILRSFVIK